MEDTHMRAHTDTERDTHLTCYDWISGLLLGSRGGKKEKHQIPWFSCQSNTPPPHSPDRQTDTHRNWHGKKLTCPRIITSPCFFTNFFAMVAPPRYEAAVSSLPLQNFFVQTTKANNTKLSRGLICCQKNCLTDDVARSINLTVSLLPLTWLFSLAFLLCYRKREETMRQLAEMCLWVWEQQII